MKKMKLFAPFLMLFAGAVVSIFMYCSHYAMGEMLPILLFVLIFFYLAGSFIQGKVIAFVEQILEEEAKEGEVIEKQASEEDEGQLKDQNAESELEGDR